MEEQLGWPLANALTPSITKLEMNGHFQITKFEMVPNSYRIFFQLFSFRIPLESFSNSSLILLKSLLNHVRIKYWDNKSQNERVLNKFNELWRFRNFIEVFSKYFPIIFEFFYTTFEFFLNSFRISLELVSKLYRLLFKLFHISFWVLFEFS